MSNFICYVGSRYWLSKKADRARDLGFKVKSSGGRPYRAEFGETVLLFMPPVREKLQGLSAKNWMVEDDEYTGELKMEIKARMATHRDSVLILGD